MKKILIYALALVLVIAFAGCGAKEKMEEKAGEALAEKIMEEAGVDADIDGDEVIIKGEDGQELTIGAGEWPTSGLSGHIPVFEGGKIVSVMEAEDSLFIMIEDTSDEDFTAYLDEIKKAFTEETYEMNTGTGLIYTAANNSDISVMLTYEKDAGFSITLSKAESEEE